MSERPFDLDGVPHLSLETVAALYRVRAVWLAELVDLGLLGAPAHRAIAVAELDRVATLVRLHLHLGLDAAAIELLLTTREGTT